MSWLRGLFRAKPAPDPLADLVAAVSSGRLSRTEAGGRAREEVGPHLHLDLVCAVGRREADRAREADWRQALDYLELLIAAIEAAPDPEARAAMHGEAVVSYIYAATAALIDRADTSVYTEAVALGNSLAESSTASRLTYRHEALHALGVLHLDPFFTARQGGGSFEMADYSWRARDLDPRLSRERPGAPSALPSPLEAIEQSISYLERALEHRSGRDRGFTLKTLCAALCWKAELGGAADAERISALVEEALPLVPPPLHAELCGYAAFAQGEGEAAPQGDVPPPPDELIAEVGRKSAIDRYRVAIVSRREQPELAIELCERIWPFMDPQLDQLERAQLGSAAANAMLRLATAQGCTIRAGSRIEDVCRRIDALTVGRRSERTAMLFAGAALSSEPLNREAEAIVLVDESLALLEDRSSPLFEMIAILRAGLLQGAGANNFHAGDFAAAVAFYVASLRANLELRLTDRALAMLEAAEASSRTDAANGRFAVELAHVAPAIWRAAGAPGLLKLRETWATVVARAFKVTDLSARGSLNGELCWLTLQTAKGAAFGSQIAGGPQRSWKEDPNTASLMGEISECERTVDPLHSPITSDMAEPLLLAFLSEAGEDLPGPEARLLRLKQRFDQRLLMAAAGSDRTLESLLLFDTLTDLIGEDTLLLSQFLGRSIDGASAILTAGLSAQSSFVTFGLAPDMIDSVTESVAGVRVTGGWMAKGVEALRKAIQRESGSAVIDEEAASLLQDARSHLFGGGVDDALKQAHAGGKRHLCIHPHEALHFHPQHLVGLPGRALADDWVVTYLPHLSLLRRRSIAPSEAGRVPVTAIALGYENGLPHQMSPLFEAVPEAKIIAAAMGGRAFVDADATVARLREALRTSRRIHLACHALHDPAAASFQTLLLHPHAGDDGRFQAHEVGGLDLRHVELVTLSACETALGRFDPLDNLRGLTANLFLAGVQTIVSCLWPVGDRAARDFFETLYRSLAAGEPRREAFQAALAQSRRLHPQARDWGTFHYAGAW